ALAEGHETTLFNRGKTNPELSPELERLVGDRSRDLSALAARTWDVVLDVASSNPDHVRRSVEALADTARYVFVSTVSVYVDQSVPPVEGAAVHPIVPGTDGDLSAETYGARKAACEQVVVDAFGDRALVVRPALLLAPPAPP